MRQIDWERFARDLRIKMAADMVTGAALALATGVAESTISRVSQAGRTPRAAQFLLLCEWMGRDPMAYLREEGPAK